MEYTYNVWGQLTKYSDDLGETASYSYYSDGLRASKTIGSNTTKYYYDGDNVINETLNGNSYATNVLGVNGYISRKQNGTTGYLFKNAHGDVLSAYSSTTNKFADYTYDAWGNERSKTETSSFTNNPLRYCGEYYDYESGMTYLRARYYDSDIKRFISEDPIKDGLNWYSYCYNNPIMFMDPLGLDGRKAVAIVGLDGGEKSWVFEDDIKTWEEDNKDNIEGEVKIFNAADYDDAKDLLKAVVKYSKDVGGLDVLLYAGHSNINGLYIFNGAGLRESKGALMEDYNMSTFKKIKFNEGANIKLMGCEAGGNVGYKNFRVVDDKLYWHPSIAQIIANKTKVTTWAYVNKTSYNDNGYQIPVSYGEQYNQYKQANANEWHWGRIVYDYQRFDKF